MTKNSTLRSAYVLARQANTMEPLRQAFLATELYVVVKMMPPDYQPAFHAVPSPKAGEFCITVAEDPSNLSFIKDVDLCKMTGKTLLDIMPPNMGIIIMYDQGGDYITCANLNWFRSVSTRGTANDLS